MRGRWPQSLRVRLTLIFAGATALMLAVVGVVVVSVFSSGITRATDSGLQKRGQTLRSFAEQGDSGGELVSESGERLLQIYDRRSGGRLASSRPIAGTTLLTPDQVQRAATQPFTFERERLAEGEESRIRAFSLGPGQPIAALGESLDRDHDLRLRLVILLSLALPTTLLLTSYLGYRVAGSALRSVEQMRARAASIDDGQGGERLPVTGTGDEIDRLGETFNALLDRIASAVEHERRVVADASHELRTPLAILRAELEIASQPQRTPEQVRAAVDSSLEETVRLSHLADDLLVLARLDQRALPLRLEPTDVGDILRTAAERNAPAVETAGRALRTTVAIDGGAVVLVDPVRVAQVLDNLIANALRHGAGLITLEAKLDGERIAVSVRDEGPGFPPEILPHAFERFSQGDPAHGGAGSGLGLAIVDGITRAQGGTATAANDGGGGAVVTVTFPPA